MKKSQTYLPLVVLLVAVVAFGIVTLQKVKGKSRPADKIPNVVSSADTGVRFIDPFLSLEAPLPESFEAGARSQTDGWDRLTIVPVGNVDQLPTYNYVIEYRTRKQQHIANLPSFLQSLYGTSFVANGEITVIETQQNLYASSGTGEQYQAVHFVQEGNDVLMVAKAKDAAVQKQFGLAFVDFVKSFVEAKSQ